jgi:hypothetical protein
MFTKLTDTTKAPVYVPGDRITFRIEIEHAQNFRTVVADFRRRPEREGEGAPTISIASDQIYLRNRNDEGWKVSEVEVGEDADPDKFAPGVYELVRVRGKTVMYRAVVFELDERLQEVRFYSGVQ